MSEDHIQTLPTTLPTEQTHHHSALSPLEHPENYVRMLFIDYSSAFNAIVRDILVGMLMDLDSPPLT